MINGPEFFFLFVRNFANRSNGSVEKWVFIAEIYGQLTKQHKFGKKNQTNSSFLPQFDGFRIRRVVLERVLMLMVCVISPNVRVSCNGKSLTVVPDIVCLQECHFSSDLECQTWFRASG